MFADLETRPSGPNSEPSPPPRAAAVAADANDIENPITTADVMLLTGDWLPGGGSQVGRSA